MHYEITVKESAQMKFLMVSWRYIRHNLAPIILTVIFITVSIFGILTVYGQYRYTSHNRDRFAESGLDDALYFMPMADDMWADGDPTESNGIYDEFSFYNDNDSVDVITYLHYYGTVEGMEFDNVYVYGKRMIESFPISVDEGRWLDAAADEAEIVLAGAKWRGVKVGDRVKLTDGGEATVVGKIDGTFTMPDFNATSNSKFPADIIFTATNSGIFATEHVMSALPDDKHVNKTLCFFIEFCGDIDAAAEADVKNRLLSIGKLVGYENIIKDSNEKIDEWIKNALPLPVFMLIIATINIICISAITVKRSMTENSRYYLVGCSTGQIILKMSVTMSVMFSTPTLLNVLSVSYFPNVFREDRYSAVDYILDASCSWIALFYMLAIVLIVTLISIVMCRKYSPLEFYRRQI